MTLIFWVVMFIYLWAYCYAVWPKVTVWRETRAFRKELDQLNRRAKDNR